MTLRHWDAPCRIVAIQGTKEHLFFTIELFDCYGDASGGKGMRVNICPNQLNADRGWEEIFEEINKLLINQPESRKEKIMSRIEESYSNKSLRELAEVYNSLVPKEKRIKKFKDKATALKRMADTFKNPVKTLIKEEGKNMKEASDQKDLTAAIEKEKNNQFKLVGRKSKHAGKKIYKISKENPRREGSAGFKNWSIYKDGMSYEDFILSKGGAEHLNWDIEKGFIELK